MSHPLNSIAATKINTLKKSSNILINIVNDILDYSSLQTGNIKLYPKEFSFREMIKHVENTLRNEIESKNIEFDVLIDERIEDILIADEIRLSQILLNLLNNSKKFTKKGKISLIAKQILTDEKDISFILEVRDTGIGMSQEIQKNLFQPFTQGNQSNTKEFKGTGLGLSIVKSLVNIMRGRINVYSSEGVGTTFVINLNFPFSKQKLVSMNKNEIVVLPQIKKALLVEDDKINQYVIKAALQKRNLEVDILENGLDALNALINKDNSYDIVFMDVQMPIMDGHEATRRIREYNTQIPIIALSAGVLPENVKESFNAGMNMHIIKPIVVEEMNEVLNKFLI